MSSTVNRRLQFQAPGATLQLVEAKIPETPPKGLVVKTEFSGICHSDVHIWHSRWRVSDEMTLDWGQMYPHFGWKWPIVMGHEVMGRVYQIGNEVGSDHGGLVVGDRVLVYSWLGCGKCKFCDDSQGNFCPEMGLNALGCSINTPGGYQDYVAVRDVHEVIKLPEAIQGDVGCMLGCSALTAYHAVLTIQESVQEATKVKGSAVVLIMGAGGLGQWAISLIKVLLPPTTQIFAADSSQENLEIAKQRGATPMVWARDAEQAAIIETTKSVTGGIDASIDFVGLPIMVERAFSCANKNATLAQVGLAGGTMKISTMQLTMNNVKVAGVVVGNIKQNKELVELLVKHPEIQPPPITHVRLQDTEGVIRQLEAGTYKGRAVIDLRKDAPK